MRKNWTTKLLCLLLCLSMLLPTLAACNKEQSPAGDRWQVAEDQAIELEMELEDTDGQTKLVLTYEQEIFSTIAEDALRLYTYHEETAPAQGEADGQIVPLQEIRLTDFTVTVDDPSRLTITLPMDEAAMGYLVMIHSSAISLGKYGGAFVSVNRLEEEQLACSAAITGEYTMGDTDPVITLTVENTRISETLNPDMITLTGLFEALEITGVMVSQNQITITTMGTVGVAGLPVVGVILSEEATSAQIPLVMEQEATYRTVYIQQDSFRLENGMLSFRLVLVSDQTLLTQGQTLEAFTVQAVSQDRSELTLSIAAGADTLDGAIARLTEQTLMIPAEVLESGTQQTVDLYANTATLGAVIEYVEQTQEEATYKITADLYVNNGLWNGELTAEELIFQGDLTGAAVNSLTRNEDIYRLELSLVNAQLDPEALSLSGIITVPDGKISSLWGTPQPAGDAAASYETPSDRGSSVFNSVTGFLLNNKDLIGSISSVTTIMVNTPTIIQMVSDGATSLLAMMGVIDWPEEEATLNSLRDQIEEVQGSINELDKKLNGVSSAMTAGFADSINATHINTYVALSGNWQNFIANYVVPLQRELNQYKLAYNEYMLNFVNNAHTQEGTVAVYHDVNNCVTLPHPTREDYAIDGTEMQEKNICLLNGPLRGVVGKVMENGGRLYDGYWEDVLAEAGTLGIEMYATGRDVETTTEEYLRGVQLEAASYALNKAGAEDILEAYTSFCTALAGQGSNVSMKPLDSYTTMLSMFYNFHIEAEEDIAVTLDWLSGILLEGSSMAVLAHYCTPTAEENLVSDACKLAVEQIESTSALVDRPDQYSFVANKELVVYRMGVCAARDGLPGRPNLVTEGPQGKPAFEAPVLSYEVKDAGNHYQAGTYMTETQILLMMDRYEKLNRLGITAAGTFADYLVSLGVLDANELYPLGEEQKAISILTGMPWEAAVPLDNSVKISVMAGYVEAWAKEGDVISIGTNGKLRAKYFSNLIQIQGNTLGLDGQSHKDVMLSAYGIYNESHIYWINNEYWRMREITDDGLLIFRLQ